MPEIRKYIVMKEQEVTVTADNPYNAQEAADKKFLDPRETSVRITRMEIREDYSG